MLKLDLAALQTAPFKARTATGGSPAYAARLLRTGKAEISATTSVLSEGNPPPELEQSRGPLAANYAALDRIYSLGVSSVGYDYEADRLSGVAGHTQEVATGLLDRAGSAYAQRARQADNEATVGAGAAIVLLLFAFGFLYRQNARLLDTSRNEARSDALTGLPNRRALMADLETALVEGTPDRPLMLGLFDLNGFKEYNDTFGHPAGDALLARLGNRLQDRLQNIGIAYRMGGDEFCVLATVGAGMSDELIQHVTVALSESGESFRISCAYGGALIPIEASSAEEALQLADQRMYAQKAGTASAMRQSRDVLLKVLDERDNSLQTHAGRVAALARRLSARIGLPEAEQEQIELAADLHDIGKSAIPDSLLGKPSDLSSTERKFIERHSTIGERIVRAAPSLSRIAPLVRSTHERIDGHGYPDGLSGNQIPIGARIVAICDAYDAMMSQRPYRAALSSSEALANLEAHSGTQFDTALVASFKLLVNERDAIERAA